MEYDNLPFTIYHLQFTKYRAWQLRRDWFDLDCRSRPALKARAVEVELGKNRLYTLYSNGRVQHDRVGSRFINEKGYVKLHGVDSSNIKSAKIYFYEF